MIFFVPKLALSHSADIDTIRTFNQYISLYIRPIRSKFDNVLLILYPKVNDNKMLNDDT